jgi:hypothetical protein
VFLFALRKPGQQGLPDDLFSNKKSQFGYIWEGLGMENVGVYYDHLEYFAAIWYNLWPFDIDCGHLVYFSPLWYVWTKKNLATLVQSPRLEIQAGSV